jgi:hypothetical protein
MNHDDRTNQNEFLQLTMVSPLLVLIGTRTPIFLSVNSQPRKRSEAGSEGELVLNCIEMIIQSTTMFLPGALLFVPNSKKNHGGHYLKQEAFRLQVITSQREACDSGEESKRKIESANESESETTKEIES